ncbi:NAD(P)H-binding protein [Streptomyces sp. NPDC017991]|uniref:NmrA family NAD(P)-binding protein n=1 Tax=Streptomyces sp. NPDC017991 TaxID=3365026 RepID=UPI0037A267A9
MKTLSDTDTVNKAFDGADTVFWLVPPNPAAEDLNGYYLGFTRPAAEAVRQQGVRRVVGVSSLGHDYGRNAGNLSAAFAMDDLIEDTGVAYRSLRMSFFMENLLMQAQGIKQGVFSLPNSADRLLRLVATPDIAAAAADVLSDASWSGQASIPVLSPDALTPNDMAHTMSEVLGRPVAFQQTPLGDFKATMLQYGLSDSWAQGLVDMATAQNDGIYEPEAATATPSPTTFAQWCEQVLKPATA